MLSRTGVTETIVEEALLHVRPIMMTVSAIIAGLVPIKLGVVLAPE